MPYISWYTYNPSLGYGIHIGSKQKIWKHLFVVEQVGYDSVQVKGTTTFDPGGAPEEYISRFSDPLSYFYFRAGFSYRL